MFDLRLHLIEYTCYLSCLCVIRRIVYNKVKCVKTIIILALIASKLRQNIYKCLCNATPNFVLSKSRLQKRRSFRLSPGFYLILCTIRNMSNIPYREMMQYEVKASNRLNFENLLQK